VERIRIAFVASTFGIGGAERVIAEVIARLRPDRFAPSLYFLREAGPVGRTLLERGIAGAERLERRRGDPLASVRLWRYFRKERPHVVFCMDHHNAMLAGRLAGLAAGARALVIGSHSTGLFGRRGSLRRRDRWLLEFTDCVVALSGSHARYLREREGVPAGKLRVIENGIDVDAFGGAAGGARDARAELGIGAAEAVVTMVAGLRPEKAHEVLLEAAVRLRSLRPAVHFWIVGEGARRAELEARVDGMDLRGRVHFLGARRDVPELLRASTVLVLPSHPVVETLPLAVLEAMAAGVPVVATPVGSIPEVIRDGENGLLVPPADAAALAGAIASLVGDGPRARRLAEAGRRTVAQRYSAARMAAGYAALFDELAGNGTRH
jgi:glycosyltransferase involved in cell wall biosynthesis